MPEPTVGAMREAVLGATTASELQLRVPRLAPNVRMRGLQKVQTQAVPHRLWPKAGREQFYRLSPGIWLDDDVIYSYLVSLREKHLASLQPRGTAEMLGPKPRVCQALREVLEQSHALEKHQPRASKTSQRSQRH